MTKKIWIQRVSIVFASFFFLLSTAHAQRVLKAIKSRDALRCGVNENLSGFSSKNSLNEWNGFEVDFCRALAAAIFDDPNKVIFTPLKTADREEALKKKKVDLVVSHMTATMRRESSLGVVIPVTTYFDGQGLLVRKEHGFSSAKELDKKTICVVEGTYDKHSIENYFDSNGLSYELKQYDSLNNAFKAYENNDCIGLTADSSMLLAIRMTASVPEDHAVLPEIISKKPIGPVILHNDWEWFRIVRWTHMAMLNAEELGVTQDNVQSMLTSKNLSIRQLLGVEDDFGVGIGLSKNWAYQIIKYVGNYSDVFERNLGEGSPLKLKRGLNALWTKGGLQYGLPIR